MTSTRSAILLYNRVGACIGRWRWTVLNLHSYTKDCYFELSLLQELTRPVPFNVDGAQSFSLLNKAMLIIFWVISAHCLQCFDTVSWATGKASAVIWLELYTFESSGCQCVSSPPSPSSLAAAKYRMVWHSGTALSGLSWNTGLVCVVAGLNPLNPFKSILHSLFSRMTMSLT